MWPWDDDGDRLATYLESHSERTRYEEEILDEILEECPDSERKRLERLLKEAPLEFRDINLDAPTKIRCSQLLSHLFSSLWEEREWSMTCKGTFNKQYT